MAQNELGFAYHSGKSVPQDYAEAVQWFRKAADQGFAEAQVNLGNAYHEGTGVPQDYSEAARWYGKAADQGFAEAQVNLGNAYHLGTGVPKDKAKAYFWTNLAAALNRDAEDSHSAKLRDSIAATLTPVQLSAIQRKCRQWMDAFEKRKAQK